MPNAHCPPEPASETNSGGDPADHVEHPVPDVHVGAVAVEGAPVAAGWAARVLVVLRSAGCCNNRIAFGLIGFLIPLAGKPAPFAVGAVTPRANPSDSHSLVTAVQAPALLRYSTRSQPSIRFQADELAVTLYGVKALETTGRPGLGKA